MNYLEVNVSGLIETTEYETRVAAILSSQVLLNAAPLIVRYKC